MPIDVIAWSDARAWDAALVTQARADAYYRRGYLGALAARGEGEPFLLHFSTEGSDACHVVMRRPLAPGIDGARSGECDLISPYGYAGPLMSGVRIDPAALDAAWAEAARELRAVTEFVRFHPVLCTHAPYAESAWVESVSQTVVMDLNGEPRAGLSATCEKNLRWAEKKGVTTRVLGEEGLAVFSDLYRTTMDRRGARDYYYFDDDYFRALARGLGENLRVGLAEHEGRTAAAALVLFDGELMHYHLGASDNALRSLCPTNHLLVSLAEWGRARGARWFHLGGGVGAGDSLFRFKAGFSPLRREFCVGRRVWNEVRYRELCATRGVEPGATGFFPAYRAPAETHE